MDYNQILISNLMVGMKQHGNSFSEDMLRHMALNSIRSNYTKFKGEYGKELVIACDSFSWRKKAFPYYKAGRAIGQAESPMDWEMIYGMLNGIQSEIAENFPYNVIKLDGAEADDIIGTLCHEFGEEMNINRRILVISGDKDFIQLGVYGNVDQYSPVLKRRITHNNPEQYLREHIARGDGGDGIPNYLASDDSKVLGTRQPPITKKRLEEVARGEFTTETKRNFERNRMLIDLRETPQEIKDQILEIYHAQKYDPDALKQGDKYKIYTYMVSKKLKFLLDKIGDFT